MAAKIQIRRDTATALAAVVLDVGEPALAYDTPAFAIGDGATAFASLPKYLTTGNLAALFAAANLSGLPTSNPGSGKPWLNGGVLQVGA